MEKMTINQKIDAIVEAGIENLTAEDFAFLIERAQKSVRKPTKPGNRKPTAKQVENEEFKAQIVNILVDGPMTATQVAQALSWDGTQKAAALLTQLKNAGAIVREKAGKNIVFKLV